MLIKIIHYVVFFVLNSYNKTKIDNNDVDIMKRILTMLLAFALCCTTCYGMEFVDTFSSTQNTDAASYQNLVTRAGDPMDDFNWPAAQDQTFCSLPSASTVGSVLYQIRGAQTLEVAVYSRKGTFSTYSEELDAYTLGYFAAANPSLARKEMRLSPSTGGVYIQMEDGLARLTGVQGGKAFLPTAERPEDLIPYGLQVYAGKSQGNLRLLTPTRKKDKEAQFSRPGTILQYYDVFSYTLPADCDYVKLVLRDYTSFPMENGAVQANNVKNPLRLANAVFTGERISVGPPAEEPSSSIPSSSTPPSSSSGSNSTPHGGSGGEEEDPDLEKPPKKDNGSSSEKGKEIASSSSSSSSKTAGAKVSSSSPKAVVRASSPSTSSSRSSSKTGSSPAAAPAATQQIILEEEASAPSRSGFYLAAAVYLSAAAAGLLLFWEKKSRSTGEEKDSDNPS